MRKSSREQKLIFCFRCCFIQHFVIMNEADTSMSMSMSVNVFEYLISNAIFAYKFYNNILNK